MSWQTTPHSQPTSQRTAYPRLASAASASPHHTLHHTSSYPRPTHFSDYADDVKHASSAPRTYKQPPLHFNSRATSQPALPINRALFPSQPQPPPPLLTHHSSYVPHSLLDSAGGGPVRSHAYSPPPSHFSPTAAAAYSPPLSPSSPPMFASHSHAQSHSRRPVPRVLRGMSALDIHGGSNGRQQRQAEANVEHGEEEWQRRRRKREGGVRWERDRRSWLWGWRCCRHIGPSSQSLPLFSPPAKHSKALPPSRSYRLVQLLLAACCLLLTMLLAYTFLPSTSAPPSPFDPPPLPASLPFHIPSLTYLPTQPLPLPPPLPASAVGNRSVLLFAVLRDYNAEFAAAHADEFARYRLALTSWLSLAALAAASASAAHSVGALDVLLFVDSAESCAYMAGERLAVQCEALSGDERCVHRLPSGSTRPYMHCVWESVAARELSSGGGRYSDYLFVNGDILLFPSLLPALSLLHRTYPAADAAYALVTRRRDKSLADLTTAALTPQQLADTERSFSAGSVLHDAYGIDVFLLSAALFPAVADRFPAFLIGVYRWDNWLLAELLRASSAWQPVVDASRCVVAGHDSLLSDHLNDAGREWNDDIAKRLLGQAYRIGNADNADARIVPVEAAEAGEGGVEWRVQLNLDERMQLHAFRRARLNTLALVPLGSADMAPRRDTPRAGLLSAFVSSPPPLPALSVYQLFLCTAQRLSFTEFVFVAEDAAAYWTLLSQQHSNVVLNVNRSLILAAPPAPVASSAATSSHSSSSSSVSLLSFNSSSYTQLHSALLFTSHLAKQLLSYPTHALLLHPSTQLLSHPLAHLNASCDLHSSASLLSPSFLLLTSHPPPHHSYPAWPLRKVDECVVREADVVVDERRKRQRRALRRPAAEQQPPATAEEEEASAAWERFGLMGAVGRQCLQETVQFQLQALPSFVHCRDERVDTWARLEADRAERARAEEAYALSQSEEEEQEEAHEADDHARVLPPWPFAVISADDAAANTSPGSLSTALVLHSLSNQCVAAPAPAQPSTPLTLAARHAVTHAPIFVHVHVRADASEQSIRLYLRSLVLADYTSLPPASPLSAPLLHASFDLTALPYAHPPSPLHLSSRISAIVDEYDADVDGLRLTLHSRLQAAELTAAAAAADADASSGVLFSLSHEGEVYVSTRLVREADGWHLFVDNGMLMPHFWYQHFLAQLAQSHTPGLLGLALFALPLPPALLNAGVAQAAWHSPYIPSSHSLLGVLLPASSLLAFHRYVEARPDEACDSDARTMEKAAMHDGLFLRYLTDVTHASQRRQADEQAEEAEEERVGLVDVRLGKVSGGEALRLEYQLWLGYRHDRCEW